MRVALVITNLATGGAETMLLKLLTHLDCTRFQPTVISLVGMGEVGPRIAALGVPVHALGMRDCCASASPMWCTRGCTTPTCWAGWRRGPPDAGE
jgi:hypothetical protein